MTNVKEKINSLLSDALNDIQIFAGYPNTIEKFPCVCFMEDGQSEVEFADNTAHYNDCEIELHIFTKKLSGYKTSYEIAFIIDSVMSGDNWVCLNNRETPEPDNEVEHRILSYRKDFLFERNIN